MKNQYFGDVNDYRKYGLLRALTQATGLPLGVCWLLTEEDGRNDGEFRTYLAQPERWRHHDPELYDALLRLLDPAVTRCVSHAERWGLLPAATFYPAVVPDDLGGRQAYFREASELLAPCPLLFFDPDNGLEVRSKRRGAKESSKYLYWQEVEHAYLRGHSLVIYQHFPREERTSFTARLALEGTTRLKGAVVDTFATAHVLFLLFAQPRHAPGFRSAHEAIETQWRGQIRPVAHDRW